MRFPVTFFRDFAAREKDEAVLSLEELAEPIKTTSKPRKDDLPWLKLARFDVKRSPNGSLRWNGNIDKLSGVVADYDAEEVTPEEAAERLDKAGVIGMVYTSPSHRLNGHGPRWRVVCPFSQELPPEQHYQMVARLNGLLGGILASESFVLSQAYYYGAVNGNPAHQVIVADGTLPIDRCDELDTIAIGKPNVAASGENRSSCPPEAPIEDIRAALDAIPNPLPGWDLNQGTWEHWNNVGMAIWRASGGSEEGREAFHKWSAKWPRKYDADEVEFRWNRYFKSPPNSTGFGKLAKAARWADPRWTRPSQQPQDVLARFNERYAVVNEAGKIWVFEQKHDPQLHREILVRYSFDHFKNAYMNQLVPVEKEVKKRSGTEITTVYAPAGEFWLKHAERRQYLGGVVFNRTGQAPGDCWNLWRGFAVEPRQGSWRRLHEHIDQVLCSGITEDRDYMLNTIARMVQRPEVRAEVAVVLRGNEGCGKGIVCTAMRRLWGQHGIHIASAKQLVGQFNLHLRDCVYLFADEAFFAGDKQHEGVLKALITEPTLAIEAKYGNVVMMPNMLHIWMSANGEWVVPASHEARRYFVPVVSNDKVGNTAYFETLASEIEDGGLEAMVYDMLRRDISEFNHRVIPQTAALAEQKALSLDTLDRWWLEVLDRGYVFRSKFGEDEFLRWTTFVATELLTRSYLQWCTDHRVGRPASRELLGRRFTGIYKPAARGGKDTIIAEAEAALAERRVLKQDRPWGYAVGGLEEARNKFVKKRGGDEQRWKEDDAEPSFNATEREEQRRQDFGGF